MARAVCRLVFAFSLLFAIPGCGDDEPGRPRDGGPREDGSVPFRDEDGDGISDADEGRSENRDTDGDGTPDYLDDDSDGDGYPDSEEGARDLDGDTRGNWIDTDADGNGILDADEQPGDVDGDGDPNYRDLDDDGDNLADTRELRGMTMPPADSDSDGTPDYHDPDSDNDTILDGQEGETDTDMDGTPDFLDIDSDNDGIPDLVEAGDSDLLTPPVDTDEDGTPDFRDPDSDGDGLSDTDEATTHGTSPTSADSDMDGVSDLIEVAAGTDPRNASDSPRTRGDFVFTVAYMQPPDPPRDTLDFRTNVQFADVYFAFDITTSMNAELAAMRNATTGVPAIIAQLRCAPTGATCMGDDECGAGNVCFSGACITDPDVGAGCIPDMWTGIASWSDVHTFRNRVSLQPDPAVTAAGFPGTDSNADEAPYHPPHCVANRGTGCANCAATGIGCGGFREDAIRIYIQVTDADQQCSGSVCSSYTAASAGAALQGQGIRFISLVGTGDSGGSGTPRSVAEAIGTASGTLDSAGDPFVYDAIDAAVVSQTVQAVRDIVRGVPLRVTIEATDEPDDAGDALQFIDRLETNTTAPDCAMIATEDTDEPADGFPDAFPAVTAGQRVCWDVVPRQNDTVMPELTPQIFRARLTVYGDGSPLDSRLVYFLVPPRPPVIEGPG